MIVQYDIHAQESF